MGLWNKKGIVITAISGLAGLLVSSKLEEILNEKFNPELLEARSDYKNAVLESIKDGHGNSSIFESTHDDVVDTTATEEETSE